MSRRPWIQWTVDAKPSLAKQMKRPNDWWRAAATCTWTLHALRTSLWICIATLGAVQTSAAQISPEEHASHHPEQAAGEAGAAPGEDSAAAGMGGGMGGAGMGGMMKSMGVPPPKELYPSLIALPDLPLEERAAIEEQAHSRMLEGAALLSSSLERLALAAPGDDFRSMKSALDGMREGLTRLDSGVAAQLALAEGSAPRNVALQRFKKEMNLLPPAPGPGDRQWLGLTPFHFFSMFLLVAFAGAMIWLYFLKMRRAQDLLRTLVTQANLAPPTPPKAVPVAPPTSAPVAQAKPSVVQSPSSASPQPRSAGKWAGNLKVARIFEETHDTKTFRFMQEDGGPIPFHYLPGQFLTLAIEQDGKQVKRSYTISSSPTVQDYVEISVKREEHGVVSRHLHDTLAEGEILAIKAPGGRLTFTGEGADSIVLIGGGVGITPMMSVIRYLTDRGWPGTIHFLFSCKTTRDFVFREELEYLQRRHPNLNVMATMTREKGTVWMGLKGRLTADLIKSAVGDIEHPLVHICGPPPMMDAIKGMLESLNVPADHVHTEAFGPAKAKKGKAPAKQAATAPAPKAPATAAITQPAAHEESASTSTAVTFAASEKSGALEPDETVLDVADALEVDIENSCRSGSCGSCCVKLLQGEVSMEVEDGLDPDQKAAGFILACQAKSSGSSPLIVDA